MSNPFSRGEWPPKRPESPRPMFVWHLPRWVMRRAVHRWCWSCQTCPCSKGGHSDAASAYDAGVAHLGSDLHATASAAASARGRGVSAPAGTVVP